MISKELKEMLLKTKTADEFRKICSENGNPKINEVDDDIIAHFLDLMAIPKEKQAVLYKDGVYYDYRLKEK